MRTLRIISPRVTGTCWMVQDVFPNGPASDIAEFRDESDARLFVNAERMREALAAQQERIVALHALLACYRIGRRPSEKLLDKLEATKPSEELVKCVLADLEKTP